MGSGAPDWLISISPPLDAHCSHIRHKFVAVLVSSSVLKSGGKGELIYVMVDITYYLKSVSTLCS
jgi:hypothetical protein